VGRALGLRWSRGGHAVLFGSHDLRKAKAVAARGSNSAQAGDFDAAAYATYRPFSDCAAGRPAALSEALSFSKLSVIPSLAGKGTL